MAADWIDSARSVFAERLRAARLDCGLTQAEAASRVGVAQTTIANYEQGTRFPEEVTLSRLADLFDVSLDWLFGRLPGPGRQLDEQVRRGERTEESPAVGGYLAALLSGNRSAAADIVAELETDGWSARKIYSDLFEPALRECGRRWMRGEIDIAQEHFLTHLTEVFMAQLLSRAPLPPKNGYTVVGASILGDFHNIGVRMVCDFLELEGWSAYYLGSDLPTESIVAAVTKIRPSVLALSATMPTAVESVSAVIGALRRIPDGVGTAVVVGGGAFNADAALWRQVGADAWAPSAAEAVVVAGRLVGRDGEETHSV